MKYIVEIYSVQDGKATQDTVQFENLARVCQVLSAGLAPGDYFKIFAEEK